MILKVKKTSEIVDAAISINKDGKVIATYWSKGACQGKGGWITTKISALCPIDVETDNEQHSKMCQAKIDEIHKLYKCMFDKMENYKGDFEIKEDIENVLRQMCSGRSREWSQGMVDRIFETDVINDNCIEDTIVVDGSMVVSALMEIVFKDYT